MQNRPRHILLVAPENTFGIGFARIPNLGLGYAAAAARSAGFTFDWMDAAREPVTAAKVAEKIRANDYTAVGFNIFTASLGPARKLIAELAASTTPLPPLIAGGPHPTFEPEQTMREIPALDYLFVGESEEGLPQLLECLWAAQGKAPEASQLEKVPNLCWREAPPEQLSPGLRPPSFRERGDVLTPSVSTGTNRAAASLLPLEGGAPEGRRLVRQNPRSFVEDLDRIPAPPWDVIRPDTYPLAPNGIFSKRNRIAPMIATRGCPYTCTFCGAPNSMGKKIRTRSPENLLAEIRELKETFDIHEIHFMDDNFTLDRPFLKSFCREVIRTGVKFDWACPNGVRLNSLTEETLPLMEEAGCYSFAVGIESGSQRVLDLIEKRLTLEEIEEKVNLVRRLTKIRMTGFFIIGLPGETEAEVLETIEFARKLPLHRANFFNYSPFPGSPLYDGLKRDGKIAGLDLSELYIHRIAWASDELGPEKLKSLQKRAYLRFYLRPQVLLGLAGEIRSFSQVATIGKRVGMILRPEG